MNSQATVVRHRDAGTQGLHGLVDVSTTGTQPHLHWQGREACTVGSGTPILRQRHSGQWRAVQQLDVNLTQRRGFCLQGSSQRGPNVVQVSQIISNQLQPQNIAMRLQRSGIFTQCTGQHARRHVTQCGEKLHLYEITICRANFKTCLQCRNKEFLKSL